MLHATTDPAELAKFDAIAHRFWDEQGEFRPLHILNPVRTAFVAERCQLTGATVVDVGCGGGLLAESLARAGARVTAIDLAPTMIDVARLHAAGAGLDIDYRLQSVETLADEREGSFDVVTCMEMLEHLPEPAGAVDGSAVCGAAGHVREYAIGQLNDGVRARCEMALPMDERPCGRERKAVFTTDNSLADTDASW